MSTHSACRGISGRLAGPLVLVVATGLFATGSAAALVQPFFVDTGQLSISVDAAGSFPGAHDVLVEKPSAEATVRKAYVFAASSFKREIADGDVAIDGAGIDWDFVPPVASIVSAAFADVTDLVAPKVDAAPPGTVAFAITEVDSETIDGEVLAVIFEDPSQTETRTVWLAFGGSSSMEAVDDFVVTLGNPIDPELPGAVADLGLGISFSVHGSPNVNPVGRIVTVDDVLLTSAAGGQDDGSAAIGSRITAGGIGDDNANPTDPDAPPGDDPRFDDELYSLLPFLSADSTRFTVSTFSDPGGDNFFFAYFVFSQPAAVNAGVLLDQETTQAEVGGAHTVTASVVGEEGEPAADVEVTFAVVEGPNAGVTGAAATGEDGDASFTYTGDGGAGVDVIEASIVETVEILDEERVLRSNSVRHEWVEAPKLALALEPAEQVEEVGGVAGLTATVTLDAEPAPGVTVDFVVLSGPNEGVAGSVPTAADGSATFAYQGLGGAGVDEVEAAVSDGEEVVATAEAAVEWTVPVLAAPRPDVAADDDGTILVVAEVGAGLFSVVAAVLDREGEVATAYFVNEETDVHRSPVVAALAEGGFAVAFVAGRDAPNALLGRLVDAAGPAGAVFPIAATDPGCDLPAGACAVARPALAARPGGGFAVVWEQEGGLNGRLFEAGGAAGDPFVVAAGGPALPLRTEPAVAVLADGSVAVVYTEVTGSDDEIRLARFDAAGALVADVAASRFTGGMQANPTVAAAGGRPFAFWESFGDATGAGIFGRLDPEDAGRPELQVNSVIAGDQLWPAAAVEASGLVAVAWLDGARNSLAAQRLAPGLAFVEGEVAVTPAVFLAFSGAAPVFGRTRVAALPDGSLVVIAAVAGTAADPDGGVAVGFVDPSPLADCFEDGRLICLKVSAGR